MSPSTHVMDAGAKGFARGLALDLEALVPSAQPGDMIEILSTHPALDSNLLAWARPKGHHVVEKTARPGGGVRYLVRLGGAQDDPDEEHPAQRLWFYTNFHCNLSCDYCCVRSSPRAAAAILDISTVERLAAEAPALGFRRILLTGGEPFLRMDLDDVVRACVEHLPLTILTNAMLWQGARRELLERLPRARVTLQVSLDSPDPALHDAHRGAGSWARAREGIGLARSIGFRVRVAATTHSAEQARAMQEFLEAEGVPPRDRLVRPVALRGGAKEGVPLSRAELKPEITVTTSGLYWHPVGATDADFRILETITSLRQAQDVVRDMEGRDREASERLAAVFHCT